MINLDDIRRHAAGCPGGVALTDGEKRLTWQEFAEAVERVAAGLARRIPRQGPVRSVFLADRGWELVVVMAACATLGVSCTGLDPAADTDRLTHVLDRLEPSLVFTSGAHRPVLDRCLWPAGSQALHILLDGPVTERTPGQRTGPCLVGLPELLGTPPLTELPDARPYESFAMAPDHDLTRVAVRRNPGEQRQLVDLVDEFGFDSTDVHLLAAPLWQQTAQDLTRAMLVLGARVVIGPEQDPAALAATVRTARATTGVIAPTTLSELLAHPDSAGLADTGRLRCLVTPGRHVGRWVVNAAWERLGPALHLAHCSPETGLTGIMTPEESLVVPMRSARPTLGNTVVVLTEHDEAAAPGVTGRVAVAGTRVMDGYLDDDGPRRFLSLDIGQGEQRFLVTGELGHLDEQSRLVVTGRAGGAPLLERDTAVDAALLRLEADLLNLPCLRDIAVMRVNHPELGDSLVVPFVAVAVGREATGVKALTATCARRLPSLATHVLAVDDIPYSPTGRIRETELLDAVVPIIALNLQLEQSMHQEMSS
ncbi:hypothetical protein CG740_14525 [Streptomyces sp. CB01201]|uniref:class I adenylate-forming enzyme family protein n=1 Tax=Streptomyces sp. CB01201 TaxID=2020324 RepID=UPI000C271643|nr:class I adenylate-forming enzyme family protein [Streptomyces sp. CB01201]PJN02269.1 hypothetical protein CG740_14525 [Streptomyces sp. CB01201]